MDEFPLQKIAISGPTLASIIQRFSSAQGDVDGLLFGHVSNVTPSDLPNADVPESSLTPSDSSPNVATITSYLCSGTINSFYDSLGRLNPTTLSHFIDQRPSGSLIGWFTGRRRTPLRPSLREFSVTASLSTKTLVADHSNSLKLPPCLFIIFTTPFSDQLIHTHDHRAYQFRRSTGVFEPKSMDVINIGPAFRGHYGAFCPNSPFPWLSCGSTAEGKSNASLNRPRQVSEEQRGLDMCAEGFEVGRLSQLMGSEAAGHTSGVEDLYGKMIMKLEGLARLVEKSSARVLEQENRNAKLRCKVAGLE